MNKNKKIGIFAQNCL